MQFVRDGKIYDTGTAEAIFEDSVEEQGHVYSFGLYRSPKRQLFVVEEGEADTVCRLIDDWDVGEWLSKHDAGPSAYEKLGLELEEG